LKISVDFDGTLIENLSFFRVFFDCFRKQGHKVGILTYRSKEVISKIKKIQPELEIDFLVTRDGEFKILLEEEYKLKMIDMHNIDYHFDDKIRGEKIFAVPEITNPFMKGNDSEL